MLSMKLNQQKKFDTNRLHRKPVQVLFDRLSRIWLELNQTNPVLFILSHKRDRKSSFFFLVSSSFCFVWSEQAKRELCVYCVRCSKWQSIKVNEKLDMKYWSDFYSSRYAHRYLLSFHFGHFSNDTIWFCSTRCLSCCCNFFFIFALLVPQLILKCIANKMETSEKHGNFLNSDITAGWCICAQFCKCNLLNFASAGVHA